MPHLTVWAFICLFTDEDRKSYLKNALLSLKDGSPMLFYKESYRSGNDGETVVTSPVPSYEDWLKMTGANYETPSVRKLDLGDSHLKLAAVCTNKSE